MATRRPTEPPARPTEPATEKTARAKSSTPRVRKTAKNVAAPVTISGDVRRAMIAEAAYLRAERRGFAPGSEAEDWLAAEAEVDVLLKARHGGTSQ
jgi:hypothetical protein